MIDRRTPGSRRGARRVALGAAATLALTCASPSAAQPAGPSAVPSPDASGRSPAASDGWRFSLTPYVWLPTINAKITYPVPALGGGPNGGGGSGGGGGGSGGGTAGGPLDGLIDAEIGPNQYLTSLNFALMLAGEARRGPWSLLVDFIGLRATGEGSRVRGVSLGGTVLPEGALAAAVDTGTVTTIRTSAWNLVGGYTVFADAHHQVDAIAGLRVARLEASLDWSLSASLTTPDGSAALARSGSARVARTPVDGVIGVRGRWRLDDRWSLPYHLDFGAGSSQLTWQVFVGASYAFSWGEALFAWRHLSLQDERREVFRRLTLSGPTLGATFRF